MYYREPSDLDERLRLARHRLAHNLQDARPDAGLTQTQVARILGRPQSFISKIEIADRHVDFVELQILAHIYGKALSDFEDDQVIEGLPDPG